MSAGSKTRRRRGEPLAALVLLIAGWAGMRLALWEAPFALTPARTAQARAGVKLEQARPAPMVRERFLAPHDLVGHEGRALTGPVRMPIRAQRVPLLTLPTVLLPTRQAPLDSHTPAAATVVNGTAHAPTNHGSIVQPGVAPAPLANSRWHLSAWAAWREGSGVSRVASGARPAGYGGTQAGVLAQYDLASGAHRPALHMRATYAPDRPRQAEVAAGVGLRPIAKVPVRVLGELRATRSDGRTELRPAGIAVTELARVRLPLGLTAEGYAQAGWVGGRYGTAFADGQARVTRPAVLAGKAQVRLGAGVWGGAQKFAERVDVGPTATIDLAPVRVALDYRIKVAGNAAPGSGLALTLSTGF